MIVHNIPLESFTPNGNVALNTDNGELRMVTNSALCVSYHKDDSPIKHYAYIQKKFKLPFQINMTVKINAPSLYLIIGKGHLGFAEYSNRIITDILGGVSKPGTHNIFDNYIPIDEYVDISVTYGTKAMWIIINKKCRCFSEKEPYVKALKSDAIPDEFNEGFGFAIACDKRTRLSLKSYTVTEYENEEPDAPTEIFNKRIFSARLNESEKPTVQVCIQGLSPELQKEILRTDEYLMKDMKKNLKFKLKIDGGYPWSRLTYVSPWGFRYKMIISDAYVWHEFGPIAYNTKREVEKYGGLKKSDYTEKALNKLAETSPAFADRMFSLIKECFNCHGNGKCANMWVYEYDGKKKATCAYQGGIHFKMFSSDFEDFRKVVGAINEVVS